MVSQAIRKVLNTSFDEALVRVREALATEGFGVLSEIDVKRTFEQKIGVDFRRYQILGACNPPLAHEALQADLTVGLMLPCNVVVYESDEGTVVVHAIDPTQTVAATGAPKLALVAEKVKAKLTRALAQLT